MQASCRLTQLRCWVVPGRDSSSSASSGRRVPSLHSAVEFNPAAIPPGTLVLPLRRQAAKSLPGVQDTAVPAVGADCVRHPVFASEASLLPQIRAARHRLRGSARINGVASCFYSKDCACSRSPWYPAQPSVLRSLPWAVPAQAGEAVCHPQRRSLPLFQGAQGLPSTALQSPPPPRCQTASPATLHFVPRPWSLTDSQAALTLMSEEMPATSPASTPPPARPSATKANQGHTPGPRCDIDRHLPPDGRKKGIYIHPRRQRLTPLRVH